jgi:hypothetical protein
MWLRKETLDEFKAICRDEFDVELSDVEAHTRAVEVLELFWLLLGETSEANEGVSESDIDSIDGEPVP